MRRARSPMVRQRPLTLCSIALVAAVLACSPHLSLADKQKDLQQAHHEAGLQAVGKILAAAVSAPAPSIDLVSIAPAPADDAFAAADAPAPAGPELPAVSFLGLPAVPLPYKDYSASPPAQSSAQAPAPAQATGASTVKSFLNSFIDEALPPAAKPFAGAAVSGAPLPSASQVLASITGVIPAEAPAPSARLKVNNPAGTSLVNVAFPTVDTVFSALEKLGRRRLAEDGPEGDEPLPALPLAAEAPMAAPGGLPGPQFQALPEPAPLPPLPRPAQQLQMAMPEDASSMAPAMAPASEASAQYQARPSEEHRQDYFGTLGRRLQQGPPGTVPEGVDATEPDAAMTPMSAPGGLPGPIFQALPEPAPLPALPRPTQPMDADMAPASAPMAAAGAEYQARPENVHHHGMAYFGTTGRKLQQGPPGTVPEGVDATEPDAAMTPLAAPGGQPGPTFQALPEPAPLPPLPRPAQQLQTMPADSMAPMSAPGGEAQPGAQYQARPSETHHQDYFGTLGRRLQQGPPGTVPEGVDATEPDAAMTPMSAPGALPQPGPVFQALPEPAPLPPLPRPTQPMDADMAPASAPTGQASAVYQARPEASHHHMTYMGTTGRRMLQDDGPPGTVPEQEVDVTDTESDAAMAPMSAMGGMPQPGPQFQALPQPAPLPELPRPANLQEHPTEAPEGAPAGEAQPGTILQAKNPKGEKHVNPAAKVTGASSATTVPVAQASVTANGRKLQAMAPAPAPEYSSAARRNMPPLPPVGPGMTAGAQPPQPGAAQGPAQDPPQGVGVFQADDPNAQEAPAVQMPKEYETGLINAFKQAIPQYISNALAMGR